MKQSGYKNSYYITSVEAGTVEREILFTEQKWNILKFLSEKEYSPLQLAELTETSMANISQQLKLLDAVNLVQKNKIPNRDKGKPRAMYSLAKDFAYLVVVSSGFAGKDFVDLDDHKKILLRIWLLDENIQYYVEKAFLKIEPYLGKIRVILLDETNLTLMLFGENLGEILKFSPLNLRKTKDDQKKITLKSIRESDLKKLGDSVVIYDPENLINKNKLGGDS